MKVLIVEDEPNIASFEKLELEHEGFETEIAQTGREAVAVFEANPDNYSIVLLDIMLPELNGLEVLRRIRKISKVPVILVTARGETFDKVNGLDAGADDYISKPFAIEELLARIRSVLRRSEYLQEQNGDGNDPLKEDTELKFDRLTLNSISFEVFVDKTPVVLTKTEFMLLKCLLQHRNEVLSRDFIISEVWGEDHYIDENSVDVYIRYLRSKIDDVFGVNYIKTIRGAGYIIRESANETH